MGCGSSSRPISTISWDDTEEIQSTTIQQLNPMLIPHSMDKKSPSKPSIAMEEKDHRKHILLSYHPNDQPLVLYVYEYLQMHNIRLWMNMKGQMEEHPIDIEIAAIENSAVVICFLTQKYQDSINCNGELRYAKKKGKPMIPCLINTDWKPTDWLHKDLPDSAFINFSEATDLTYDLKCEELLQRIKAVTKTEDYLTDEDEAISIISQLDEETNYDVTNIGYPLQRSSSIHQELIRKAKNSAPMTLTKHPCEGDSLLRLILTDQVYANQQYSILNDTFSNYFFIRNLMIENPTKQTISVTRITAQYQHIDGTWRDCRNIKIAPAVSDETRFYNWLPNTTVYLEPSKTITFIVRVAVQVNGKPGADYQHRARAHKTLAQPFKIRLQLQDTLDKSLRLIVEQINKPLELPNKDQIIKLWGYTDVIAFISADDHNEEERFWALVHYEETSKLRFSFGNSLSSSETKYFDPWFIKQLYQAAKQNQLTEIILEDWNNHWRNNVALFHHKTFNLYGFRIELTTPTSKTIETILLSLEKIKEAFNKDNTTIE